MGKVLDTLKDRERSSITPEPTPEVATPRPASCKPLAAATETEQIPFVEIPEPAPINSAPTLSPSVPDKRNPEPVIAYQALPPSPVRIPSVISPELVIWHQPQSTAAEAYRQVRDGLLPQLAAGPIRSLLLVPLDHAPSQTAVVVNLALALAEKTTHSILLIDADSGAHPVALLLGLALAPGWAELLLGLPLPQALQESGWPNLHIIAAGNRLVGSCSPLQGNRVHELLLQLRQQYELILVQSPPWHGSTMAAVLAHACEAACLVQKKDQATQPLAEGDMDALQKQGIRLLGSIVTS